jgi:hypothetical protein
MKHVDEIFSEEFSFSYPLFNIRQAHEYLRKNYPIVKPKNSKKFKVTDYNKIIVFNKEYTSITLEENNHVFFQKSEINPETLTNFIYGEQSLVAQWTEWDDWDDDEVYEYDDDEENYKI